MDTQMDTCSVEPLRISSGWVGWGPIGDICSGGTIGIWDLGSAPAQASPLNLIDEAEPPGVFRYEVMLALLERSAQEYYKGPHRKDARVSPLNRCLEMLQVGRRRLDFFPGHRPDGIQVSTVEEHILVFHQDTENFVSEVVVHSFE